MFVRNRILKGAMNLATAHAPVAKRRQGALREVSGIFGALTLAFFQPKERRTKTISIRITPALEAKLKVLKRLYTVASRAYSGDEEIEVTENDSAFRLLEASADAAIAEILGPSSEPPSSEEEWKRVELAIRKRFAPK